MDQAAARFWRKYATFTGRASRSEFWFAVLVAVVSLFVGGIVLPLPFPLLPETAYRVVSLVWFLVLNGYAIALVVPMLAVTWRRLHDVNSSGGLFFFGLIPLIGPIMLLINLAGVQDPDGARFDKPRIAEQTPGTGAEALTSGR